MANILTNLLKIYEEDDEYDANIGKEGKEKKGEEEVVVKEVKKRFVN